MTACSIRFFVCLVIAIAGSSCASAQHYPEKPIHIIVPYPAGGMPDRIARDLAQGLNARLNQAVIVENRGGAAGNIGFDYVARQPADGYTLLLAPASNLAVQDALFKSLPYNLKTDFAPISLLIQSPQVLVVNTDVPVRTTQELVKYSKERPNKVNFGVTIASFSHLSGEMLAAASGASFTAIPYQGSNLAMNDLLAGQVQFMFNDIVNLYPFIKAGKLRPLAVAYKSRVPLLPDVPTMAEAGFPGFEAVSWYALIARNGTPRPVIDLLSKESSAIIQSAPVRKRYEEIGAQAVGGTPEQLNAFIKSEAIKWTAVVRQVGIPPN
jgi:tripartite-type tricarboxylate transporter receptor subunit TctC